MKFFTIDHYINNDIAKSLKWHTIFDPCFCIPRNIYSLQKSSEQYKASKTGIWLVHCNKHFQLNKRMYAVSCAGGLKLVFFKKHSGIEKMYQGSKYVYGTITEMYGGLVIIHPKIVSKDMVIYPSSHILPNHKMQKIVQNILQKMPDYDEWLPINIKQQFMLPKFKQALCMLHNVCYDHIPYKFNKKQALMRLAIDEAFAYSLYVAQLRLKMIAYPMIPKSHYANFRNILKNRNISLTQQQEMTISQIIKDIRKPNAMNRIVHGEVGSGKTMIMAALCYIAVDNNLSSIVVCPTTVLAKQHYEFIKSIDININVSLCISGIENTIKNADIIISSHAIFFRNLADINKKIGAIIIDEEHKFGASQKEDIFSNIHAHRMMMSATPIPRSYYMVKYGYYDISLLNRVHDSDIITLVYSQAKIPQLQKSIVSASKNNSKIYWVCHDIENTLNTREKAFIEMGFHPIILHSRIQDKQEKIKQFTESGGVLLATTVIETGIHVPNADIIVIENACQFGLSQLHQLRGRIGRDGKKGYCCLIANQSPSSECMERMNTMKHSIDCQYITSVDLAVRGPGDISGSKQTGFQGMRFDHICDIDRNTLDMLQIHAYKCIEDFQHPAHQIIDIYCRSNFIDT